MIDPSVGEGEYVIGANSLIILNFYIEPKRVSMKGRSRGRKFHVSRETLF
jgi:hypothetical protein